MTATPAPAAGRQDGRHDGGTPGERTGASDPAHLRRVGRALDAALWLVALMVGVYSLSTVHGVAVGHGTGDPQAWLLAPIVDVALFAGITADSVLSRHGLDPGRWAAGLRWFCGAATWALNVWDAATTGDPGAITAHSVPPVVLILLAEAAPRYRQQFATLAAGTTMGGTTPGPGLPATTTVEPVPVPVRVPAPRTGTRRTGRTGTAGKPRTTRRPDAELLAALAEVPRDADGTVPVRRAAAALACGPDRARRLLAAQGLLRTPPATTATSAADPPAVPTAA